MNNSWCLYLIYSIYNDNYNNHTIATNSREKTGYPTQKPVAVINRIVKASSNPGDVVLDFFAGSGTVGEVCTKLDRRFILVDSNPEAIQVMQRRFAGQAGIEWIGLEGLPE